MQNKNILASVSSTALHFKYLHLHLNNACWKYFTTDHICSHQYCTCVSLHQKKHWDQMMRALLQAPRLSSLVWQALALPREKCPTGLACGNSFRFLKRFVSKQQKHRKRWETCEFSGFGPRTTDEEEEGGWFRSLIIDYWLWLIDYDNEWWFCDHHHNHAQVTNGWGGGSYSGPTTASTALSRTRWDLWPLWRLKTSLLPGRPEVVLQKTCKLFLKIPDMYLVQVNKLPSFRCFQGNAEPEASDFFKLWQ